MSMFKAFGGGEFPVNKMLSKLSNLEKISETINKKGKEKLPVRARTLYI